MLNLTMNIIVFLTRSPEYYKIHNTFFEHRRLRMNLANGRKDGVREKFLRNAQPVKTGNLRTRRTGLRYGDRVIVKGIPMMIVERGRKVDFMTIEEIVEDVAGKAVDHIVFK